MSKQRANLSFLKLPKGRRTVVDLLTIVGRKASPGYMALDFDMTRATELVAKYKKMGIRSTVTCVLMKAIGLAQQNHPLSRTELTNFGQPVVFNDIVGGITVEREVDGQKVLFFGEVDSPHTLSIPEIAKAIKECAEIAIAESAPFALQTKFSGLPWLLRKIILEFGKAFPYLRLQCQKATFGLTTLGKHGIGFLCSPCICTSTFGIGVVEERVVICDKDLKVSPIMTVSYNFDQRILDVNSAASFLDEVRYLVEGGLADYSAAH